MARLRVLLVVIGLCGSGAALAQGPYWGYAEATHIEAKLQEDEKGNGTGAAISVPLGSYVYATAAAQAIDAYYTDPAITATEEYEVGSVGLGLHSVVGKAHAFGQLTYGERKRTVRDGAAGFTDTEHGAHLLVGARWLITPWLSFEPAGGIGTGVIDGVVQIKVALRVVPRVWIVGGYGTGAFATDDAASIGLRLMWKDATRKAVRPRGTRVVPAVEGEAAPPRSAALAAGQTLQALRSLKLQARPLAGAAETAEVPAGEKLSLQESKDNEFGRWWRVTAGGREGWIRESFLK